VIPPLIPREVLFGNPERLSPRISPDGTRLAWIAPHYGVLNVWVAEPTGETPKVVTDDRDRGIRSFWWAPDDRRLLYVQDKGGDENWRLCDVDLDTGASRDLTPFDGVQARVEAVSKRVRDTVLVGMNKDNEQLHDVYRLDLATGKLTKIVVNPGFVAFIADEDLAVRAALAPRADGGMIVLVRDDPLDADGWLPLFEVNQVDALTTNPIGFTDAGRRVLVVSSADANAARLVSIDVATGAQAVLAEDQTYDVAAVHLHPDTRKPLLVEFLRDRCSWKALDPSVAADLAALEDLDDGDLSLEGADASDRFWLVGFEHDDGPIRYYTYDRMTAQGRYLFSHREALEHYTLARMEPFLIQARDGLPLHGYVTSPAGVPRQNLPTVLVVHGGPWSRDRWRFDPEAQWLANRGYLVVQVNYRGSIGYGKAFLNAGNREWGARMHDDLLDAVDWVVAQGWTDSGRVAIYGGSYGGYAALVGATFTPDVFRCAVDIVGPSNLKTLIESIPPYWTPLVAQFHTRVGNPVTEPEFMWERSPLSKADKIRIPVLIAQGANDPRVKQAESEQIVAAMAEKGIDHEYLLFGDEGHGFAKPENRLRFYTAADAFLAKHLGGRAEF
jgi:dipeptidyl aminopeptidase/acylaminoacyl peptidase